MNSLFTKPIKTTRLPIVLIFSALFVAGCSGSSDSQSIAEADAIDTDAINTVADDVVADDVVASNDGGAIDSDTDTVENDTVVVTPEDTVNTTTEDTFDTDETEPTAVTPDPVVPDPVVQDPVALISTRVDFDITVPAYQSNALQVRLQWGDRDISAAFVVDESWSVVDDFPVDTENTLTVTFNDDNGAITLGSFEQTFTTGSSESESFQITAAQFDTARWDDDNDGVSNLDELIAGSDPLVADTPASTAELPQAVQANLELVQDKTFRISWQPSEGAEFYRVLENLDGVSGFSQVSNDLGSAVQTFDQRVALYRMFNASYVVQSCNGSGCTDSDELIVSGTLEEAIGYFKASNTEFEDFFGKTVSLSADGNTLAVGAQGIGETANSRGESDSVYVFQRSVAGWLLQGVLRPNNTDDASSVGFGHDISLAADGNTLSIGATITGTSAAESFISGSVYIFVRTGESWQQQAFMEASNSTDRDFFGTSVSLDAEGNTLAVGAPGESSASSGVNGDQSDRSSLGSGAVYVFERSDGAWQQQAYLKASNTDAGDSFGDDVSLSADGSTLAVGASSEDSAATGVNVSQNDNSAIFAGAVYIFEDSNSTWQQQAYLKASNASRFDRFGSSVDIAADGNTLAVGASTESRIAANSGAVYVFERTSTSWLEQANFKASNAQTSASFGTTVSVSEDGNTLAVGAFLERSQSTGVNDDESEGFSDIFTFAPRPGAAYVFVRNNGEWLQQAYLKASNTGVRDLFGVSVDLSADGSTLAVGAMQEESAATGVNGDQTDNSVGAAGAVYLY